MIEKNGYVPGKRAGDVMTKPLPQILDEMSQAIEDAKTATKDAKDAAAEARQAGQEAALEATKAGVAAAKQVGAELAAYKTTTDNNLSAINRSIGWIKGILKSAGAIFTSDEK